MDPIQAAVALVMPNSGGGLQTRPPNEVAAARFAELMSLPAEGTPPAAPTIAAVSTPGPAVVEEKPKVSTLGDQILGGLQGFSRDYQQAWSTVSATLESGADLRMPDMLKLQMGLTQMSIQYELVGKAISRSTQNLDQLVKLQ